MGNYISKMNLYCLDDAAAATQLVGIDWYDGAEGYADPGQPTLALGMVRAGSERTLGIEVGCTATTRAAPVVARTGRPGDGTGSRGERRTMTGSD